MEGHDRRSTKKMTAAGSHPLTCRRHSIPKGLVEYIKGAGTMINGATNRR